MFTEYRRTAAALLLLLVLAPATSGAASWQHEGGVLTLDGTPQRIIALNWAATEALLALGITPVGVADRSGYPVWVQEPALPDTVYNVGTRSAPSLEAIAELDPELIVTSGQLAPAIEQLADIAPVYVASVYDQGAAPFPRARELLLTLGEITGRTARARQQLANLDQSLATNHQRLEAAGLTDRPIALVTFLDDRHVRINAPNGLFQAALNGLGLDNAWPQPGNFWGFSMVGLEALAPLTDARLVVISPTAPGLKDQLAGSPFWQHLPAVSNGQVYQIEPVWAYGGVKAVERLARLLTEALLAGGSDNVR